MLPSSPSSSTPAASTTTTTTSSSILCWSPHASTSHPYAVASFDVRLFASSTHTHLQTLSEHQSSISCIDWSHDPATPHLVALGLPDGRTSLVDFHDPDRYAECVVRVARPVSTVRFNPSLTQHLCVGLHAARNDSSIVLWDVTRLSPSSSVEQEETKRSTTTTTTTSGASGGGDALRHVRGRPPPQYSTPVNVLANSDTVNALAWLPGRPHYLAAGTTSKSLKVFDVRSASLPALIDTGAPGVTCIEFDPFMPERFATTSPDSGTVRIWDVRKLNVPMMRLDTGKRAYHHIQWCPTRRGVLAAYIKNDIFVRVLDLRSALAPLEVGNAPVPSIVRVPGRKIRTADSCVVSSFAWHPSERNRMLTLSVKGILDDVTVRDAMPVAVSAATDDVTFSGITFASPVAPTVSDVMQERAEQGYGMNAALNARLCAPHLAPLWDCLAADTPRGVLDILGIRKKATKLSSTPAERLQGMGYTSPERERVIAMCGWFPTTGSEDYDDDDEDDGGKNSMIIKSPAPSQQQQQLSAAVPPAAAGPAGGLDQKLEWFLSVGETERAAALAIFHDRRQRALDILAAKPELETVAMALAGCDRRSKQWRETCARLLHGLRQPYLRAAFSFLSLPIQNAADAIGGDDDLAFQDILAFGCRFLSDDILVPFLQKQTGRCITQGNIRGFLLTGLTKPGLELVQSYVDATADVQTAAIVAAFAERAGMKHAAGERWIEAYRSFLDRRRLWSTRAKFDIAKAKLLRKPADTVKPQIYARCTYCSNPLSLDRMSSQNKSRQGRFSRRAAGGVGELSSRVHTCSSCKKSLPKCALCLTPLTAVTPLAAKVTRVRQQETADEVKDGAAAAAAAGGDDHLGDGDEDDSALDKSSRWPYDKWFVWCQGCRHGGHAGHIEKWFKNHTECPVVHCKCQCNLLD